MRLFLFLVTALWACAATGAAPDAAAPGQQVEVTYDKAARFIDAGETAREVEGNIHELTRHLRGLAKHHLLAGQRLKVEIVQLDLAGRLSSSARTVQRFRVIDGNADWPRIDLRYVLSGPEGELRRGEESLIDQSYTQHPLRNSNDPLRYEERVLTQWFQSRFVNAEGQPAKR